MVSGEKRNNEEEHFMGKITTILLDIEGTTTSISFVKDTLFPYVKEHLESYVESHWNDPEFKEDVLALKEQAKKDEQDKVEGLCPIEEGEKEKESVIKNVLWQMSNDRKTTALKQLQGHIWREGYKSEKLKGHDVPPVLKKWGEENRKVYIFSSGSVEAQKLLFAHSEEGDLLKYITGHFDTTTGPKTESSSYSSIIKTVECEKEQILFLTDVAKEAEAARSAGMQAVLVVRENNAPLTDDEKKAFMSITSFEELALEKSSKRKKLSDGTNDEESGKKSEEAFPEVSDSGDSSRVNGSEAMDVDVASDELKPESSQNAENKTDDENKTESEEIEIDVVSEERREETTEAPAPNGDAPKEEEQEAEGAGKDDSMGAEDAKESLDSEPQVDVTDPAPEILNAPDPLDITSERAEENNVSDGVSAEEDSSQAEKEEPVESAELNNGTSETEKPEEPANNEGEEKERETADKTEAVEEPEAKNTAEEEGVKASGNEKTVVFTEEKEMNGQDGYDESSGENGVAEDNISLNKIVPEDKPEPTVEVNA